jgi:hypothetical protein
MLIRAAASTPNLHAELLTTPYRGSQATIGSGQIAVEPAPALRHALQSLEVVDPVMQAQKLTLMPRTLCLPLIGARGPLFVE